MARLYIKTPWSYETDSWFDVTSVNFNSQKVHEDKIFERQDILQFLSQGSKYYKYVKSHAINNDQSLMKNTYTNPPTYHSTAHSPLSLFASLAHSAYCSPLPMLIKLDSFSSARRQSQDQRARGRRNKTRPECARSGQILRSPSPSVSLCLCTLDICRSHHKQRSSPELFFAFYSF